jgi:hypothetical protein
MSTVAPRHRALAKLALTGALAGSLFGVAGCHWLAWPHDDDDFEFCDDAYDDCRAWALTAEDLQWCEADVKSCYEACEGGWEEDADDDADAETGDENTTGETGESDGGEAEGGDGDGDTGDGDTGDGDVCIELFGNCIETAETLQDVEACEALYDQCVNPGECPGCGGCPADELEACLDHYAECAALADTPEKVELCTASFDACTAPFAQACAVEENPNLEPCLEQHALCVACADGEAQISACQDVFASCMAGGE